jgi:hypothetical protein
VERPVERVVSNALDLLERQPWVAASRACRLRTCPRCAVAVAHRGWWARISQLDEAQQHYLRAKEFAEGLASVVFDADDASVFIDPAVREAFIGEPPDASGWSVPNACSRFSKTKLSYDI